MTTRIPPELKEHLQFLWCERIPLAQAMGITIVRLDDDGLQLAAPLAPNRNHMGTGFAGSLGTVATLAGLGLAFALLGAREDTDVVLQDSRARFLEPVTDGFLAICPMPSHREVDRYLKSYQQRGRARLALEAKVYQDTTQVVQFNGRFVAVKRG